MEEIDMKILPLHKSVGKQGVAEKCKDLIFITRKETHKRVRFVTNIGAIHRQVAGMNRQF